MSLNGKKDYIIYSLGHQHGHIDVKTKDCHITPNVIINSLGFWDLVIWELQNLMRSHQLWWMIYKRPSLIRGLVGKRKQLCILRTLNREGSFCFLWGCDTSPFFPAGHCKCCSQCFKTVSNISTGSSLIVSENFLCPIAMSDSQKALKLRAARPKSPTWWRRLMLMNIMSKAARVKPKSVRWHRLAIILKDVGPILVDVRTPTKCLNNVTHRSTTLWWSNWEASLG